MLYEDLRQIHKEIHCNLHFIQTAMELHLLTATDKLAIQSDLCVLIKLANFHP